jgi:dCMP deaminase
MIKKKFLDYYMRVAEETAALSYARRLQVGCVIVKDNRTLSIGYNGLPAGDDDTQIEFEYTEDHNGIEIKKLKTNPEVVHAEENAITKVAASHESTEGATIFVTAAPCINCAKLILNSKIKDVYYKHNYRDSHGIDFLTKHGVSVIQYK